VRDQTHAPCHRNRSAVSSDPYVRDGCMIGPAMLLSPGARLGPYEMSALVGAGGMGHVYRGRDTRLDRTVAIKVLAADPRPPLSGIRRHRPDHVEWIRPAAMGPRWH